MLQHGLVFEYVFVNVYVSLWGTAAKHNLKCLFASNVCVLRTESSHHIH